MIGTTRSSPEVVEAAEAEVATEAEVVLGATLKELVRETEAAAATMSSAA
jgi:hypothetical protein